MSSPLARAARARCWGSIDGRGASQGRTRVGAVPQYIDRRCRRRLLCAGRARRRTRTTSTGGSCGRSRPRACRSCCWTVLRFRIPSAAGTTSSASTTGARVSSSPIICCASGAAASRSSRCRMRQRPSTRARPATERRSTPRTTRSIARPILRIDPCGSRRGRDRCSMTTAPTASSAQTTARRARLMHTLLDLDYVDPGRRPPGGHRRHRVRQAAPGPADHPAPADASDRRRGALTAMLERVNRPDLPARDILLQCELIVRGSCGGRERIPNP